MEWTIRRHIFKNKENMEDKTNNNDTKENYLIFNKKECM